MGFIGIILLLVFTAIDQAEGIIVKGYGKRHNIGGLFFNALMSGAASLFFILKGIFYEGGLSFPKELLSYGILSCVMFALGFYFMYVALQLGSFAITRLINSFSAVVSIVYGIAILGEKAGFLTYIGIVMVFVSVILMQLGKNEQGDKKAFSVKWLVCILISAVANGFIGVISKAQQNRFNGTCDTEFMIISFAGAFLSLVILGFILERKNLSYIVRHGIPYGIGAGLVNGGKNFINLLLIATIPLSVVTPVRTGIGFIASFAISVFLYREKFTKMQIISVIIGIAAIGLFQFA